ncbi:rac GTPase-activating protein 1 [Takifugu flavidus]|uniref:Rac GTPase-activating protein 1 n=1 Tax=Takifugu flavidus TaxID=433684 RepID=A0A5C6MRP2_9TELE|nr:rac GTPase-activating protein 1 [Takifugu flavidus]XP_056896607.1 rac GTPase-activating protein 1 [Takifugu flavidus]XP_056896608.1 rac GTPase-activating protein 1 [Takifugu flavidus]XP_056896609.1 rac GTPase-activating protein 1 [Takifugu flavidus]TWW57028.1 Rac GTPase-activating protein 1 [Takifugu flavidus]
MEMAVLNLQGLYDEMRSQIDLLNDNIEPNFIQMAKNFDHCRRRWASTEQELGSCKEILTKTETERGALEVKLKHARNQVDIEIRRRQKAETECEKLDRQIQLIRDLLTSEGSSNSIQLSAEQRSALGFLNTNYQAAGNLNTSRRLTRIDESASILSDISYDKTEDSIDWDSTNVRTVRLKKREKRRSSRNQVDGPPCASKRSRSIGRTADGVNESLVAKTTVSVPVNGGPVEAIATIETIPYWTRSRRKTAAMEFDSESVQSEELFKQPSNPEADVRTQPSTPQRQGGVRLHEFVSKTVIKPESCVPCGKRIKFGKISLKCRECRVVSHPECRERCPLPCIPNPIATPVKIGEGVLADYVSSTAPMIPALVVHCINEIENRGLHETGLYRLSGADRQVKELKEKFLRCKTVPVLSKVDDIHVITGVLKDFLRNLKEPLLTFSLNRPFMEAAEISDDDNSIAQMYQTIGDLPLPNRDTLAYLIIHLQKVANSTETRMDAGNLARVFGPTIVGHSVPNPDPMTILQDTKRQPQVVERLLSMPVDYWSQFVNTENVSPNLNHLIIENSNCYSTPDKMSLLGPLTTPEHQFNKTPSSSSLSQRMRSTLTPRFGSKSKSAVGFSHQGKFFSSPHII